MNRNEIKQQILSILEQNKNDNKELIDALSEHEIVPRPKYSIDSDLYDNSCKPNNKIYIDKVFWDYQYNGVVYASEDLDGTILYSEDVIADHEIEVHPQKIKDGSTLPNKATKKDTGEEIYVYKYLRSQFDGKNYTHYNDASYKLGNYKFLTNTFVITDDEFELV